MTKNLWSN